MAGMLRRTRPRSTAWRGPILGLLISALSVTGCGSFSCGDLNIRLTGGNFSEKAAVCTAAQETQAFFRPAGLAFPEHLQVALVPQLWPNADFPSLGSYHPQRNMIRLRDYRSALASSHSAPPAFGIPMSPPLWRSYLVHEIAHAFVERHARAARVAEDALAPTEYIAAVAQLSALSDEVRGAILVNYSEVTAFEDEASITDLYYFMKPCEFAVRAYRHYLKPENGLTFMRKLFEEGLPNSGVRGLIPFF